MNYLPGHLLQAVPGLSMRIIQNEQQHMSM